MSTPFINGFKLEVDPDYKTNNLLEDGLNSIGCLSAIATDCSNVVACLNDGSVPSDMMVNQIAYASSVISGLANEISNILTLVEVENEIS